MELSKERLEAFINQPLENGLTRSEQMELARRLIAAEEQQPVAWRYRHHDGLAQSNWRFVDSEDECNMGPNYQRQALYLHPQQGKAVQVPDGLNPATADLVMRFASALAEKLYKAEEKYGRSTDWMKDDWYNDCLQSLWEHIEKGDPRDVAAYCAFMWHHGWVTTDYDPNVQSACRAAMLEPVSNRDEFPDFREKLNSSTNNCREIPDSSTNSPVIPDGWVLLPAEPTQAMMNAWLSEVANWRGHGAGYRAMIAAAPEVK